MIPEEKAKDLIKRFGNKAEEVAAECLISVDAARTPYWRIVKQRITFERLLVVQEIIKKTKNDLPPGAYRYE